LAPGEQIDIVDGEEGFAEALLAALADPERCRRVAEAGRRKVLDEYDWGALSAAFERSWERCRLREGLSAGGSPATSG
jgi:glycosyltransferase involved in cell wall biosynthesis